MIRLVLYLVAVAALATALAWLADRPGSLVLTWQGYEIETTVFRAVVISTFLVGLSVFAWSLLRQLWTTPAALGNFFYRRRQERGLDALSSGMIAVGAGDRALATRYALQARRSLPNEPMTHLLRAQAAQLADDRATARRIFEAMLGSPDTEQLGLRGLFLEAERERETEAARQFADRALRLNPKLGWPIDALFDLQCRASDWTGALATLATGRKHGQIERALADRRRAVLLTAQAQALEDSNGARAQSLALEAHALAPDLVPAAAIAARLLASRGATARVAKIIERTWKRAPHPDLATAYAYARPGDSPRDRVERVKRLARMTPHSSEAAVACANAAIEARDWEDARKALGPLLDGRLTPRICTLMARIEAEERNDAGRVREWLARAVNAPRDPAWTADGVVSERWAPISPVTGALDAFQWRIPVEASAPEDQRLAMARLEELVSLGALKETLIEARPLPDGEAAEGHTPAASLPAATPEPNTSVPGRATGSQAAQRAKPEATSLPPLSLPRGFGARAAAPSQATDEAAARQAEAAPRRVPPHEGRPAAAASASSAIRPVHDARIESGMQFRPSPRDTVRSRPGLEARILAPQWAPDDPGLERSEDMRAPSPYGPGAIKRPL